MRQRRGTVFIAPAAFFPGDGRMVNPATARFWVSWQDEGLDRPIEDDEITGAEAAIEWGRERAEEVLIRLGHSGDTYFSAGDIHVEDDDGPLPVWPPAGPPREGWFTPGEELLDFG